MPHTHTHTYKHSLSLGGMSLGLTFRFGLYFLSFLTTDANLVCIRFIQFVAHDGIIYLWWPYCWHATITSSIDPCRKVFRVLPTSPPKNSTCVEPIFLHKLSLLGMSPSWTRNFGLCFLPSDRRQPGMDQETSFGWLLRLILFSCDHHH